LDRYRYFFNVPERPIWKKASLPSQVKPKLQEVYLSKTNSILKGNNGLDVPASYQDGFL
jgi:hypothetical protein